MEPIYISNETRQYIIENRTKDVKALALSKRASKDIDLIFALQQIKGWQIAKTKLPQLSVCNDIIYPEHLPLEQCSSEATAIYKSSLVSGSSFADLTGGFGIDFLYMSEGFQRAIYVEKNSDLCKVVSHNLKAMSRNNAEVVNADSLVYLQEMEPVDCIYIDPARRDSKGGKCVYISDCEPDVQQIEKTMLSKAKKVVVKLSPMLDISKAIDDLSFVSEVHIVSVNNECKEFLLILEEKLVESISINCVNIKKDDVEKFVFDVDLEHNLTLPYSSDVLNYLYEPNSSVMKSGGFKSLVKSFPELIKLHPNTHLYTSENLVNSFPGRTFVCLGVCDANRKSLVSTFGDISKANVTVRNFPSSVAELRKKLRVSDGGEFYIFAATLYNEKRSLVVCKKA